MKAEARNTFYAGIANKITVKRVGQAEDIAKGVMYLIQNGFVTGTDLHIDGGHILI